MNIDTLRLIVQILEVGKIRTVAEANHISQSALSQHIKNFEQHLSMPLIKRSNKGIEVTAQGEIFYRHSKNIVECYDAMLLELKQEINTRKQIRIFSNPLFSNYAFPCTLLDLQKHFPLEHLQMATLPSYQVEQKILIGEGDIGFVNGQVSNPHLTSRKVLEDPIYFVAQFDQDIKSSLTQDEFYHTDLIMSSGYSVTKSNIEHALVSKGIDLRRLKIRTHMDTIESIKLSVQNGLGCSFLPYSAIKKELYLKKFKIVELPWLEIHNDFYLILNPHSVAEYPNLKALATYLISILDSTLC